MKGAYPNHEDMIKFLSGETDLTSDRDWSAEILMFIALAINACNQLKKLGYDARFKNRKIILPSLERAWREAIHQRQQLPLTYFTENPDSKAVEVTRFGNIENKTKGRDMD
jgi:hypothetical protein